MTEQNGSMGQRGASTGEAREVIQMVEQAGQALADIMQESGFLDEVRSFLVASSEDRIPRWKRLRRKRRARAKQRRAIMRSFRAIEKQRARVRKKFHSAWRGPT